MGNRATEGGLGRRTRIMRIRTILVQRNPYCHYCTKQLTFHDSTLDHVIPLSKGGADDESNFVLSCRECNEEKADRTEEEYMQIKSHPSA